ncbi:hypothetical protein Cgig2_012424 [Carnegiea gigantea]|uniref:Uncharacterized protein n=1 Tax=Carnegiea gigantea TaxID=171969 RepID=A0A9Q1KMM6_9CARY|nr:hypothetical protein Cgig2_012424 [Carnegiea gigantea]
MGPWSDLVVQPVRTQTEPKIETGLRLDRVRTSHPLSKLLVSASRLFVAGSRAVILFASSFVGGLRRPNWLLGLYLLRTFLFCSAFFAYLNCSAPLRWLGAPRWDSRLGWICSVFRRSTQDPDKSASTKIKFGKQRGMAKRKRLPFHKEKLHEVQSVDAVSGSNCNVTHEEIAKPRAIDPAINRRPIFVLEQASLKIGFVGKKRKILYASEDAKFLLKKGKNLVDYRPDILYQALHEILDSRINKVGGIEAVYVKTDTGILFEVKTHARIPRTWKRFSYSSPKIVDIEDYLSPVNDDLSLVFVVGATAKGKVNKDGMDDYLSVSSYPLSARCCLGLICRSLEEKWKIH